MSYLNSLLSSIGGSASGIESSTTTTSRTPSNVITSDKSRSTTPSVVPPQKRKAEGPPAAGPPAKAVKTDAPVARLKSGIPSETVAKTLPLLSTFRPPQAASKPASASRPLLKPTTVTSSLKPNGTTTTSITTSRTITKPSSEATRPTVHRTASATIITPNKAPAKSSYRAILERAEAAKKATADQLQIKNKPIAVAPKLSHKERLAKEEETRKKTKLEARSGNRAAGAAKEDRSGLSKTISKLRVEEEIVKPKKVPVDLGYKGTMRANPTASASRPIPKSTSSYTGTSRTAAWIDSSKQARPPDDIDDPLEKRYRYASETEEEDEDGSGDEDKPLGFWDMEEEEEASLKAAQAEDARALREEKEHQTAKLARKKALEQIVASRAEKK